MKRFVELMTSERVALVRRRNRLIRALDAEDEELYTQLQRDLMSAQLHAMNTYCDILDIRIREQIKQQRHEKRDNTNDK